MEQKVTFRRAKKSPGFTNNLRMKAGINQAGIHARRQNRDSEGHEWDGIRMSYGKNGLISE